MLSNSKLNSGGEVSPFREIVVVFYLFTIPKGDLHLS